jgi:hypothetical protein
MALVGAMKLHEEFEYFEENVIREGSDSDLLVRLAYTIQSQ